MKRRQRGPRRGTVGRADSLGRLRQAQSNTARGGLVTVLNAIHAPGCRLGKNARLVAVAIAWRMGGKSEAWPGLPSIMSEAHMSRSVAFAALSEACGAEGLFDRRRRGLGQTNLYTVKKSVSADLKVSHFVDLSDEGKKSGFGADDVRVPVCRTEKEQKSKTEASRERAGNLLNEIACPSCEREGHLSQSPGRNGNPPGFWCRRPRGCGFNFAIDCEDIVSQLTPGARKAVREMAPKIEAKADPIAEGLRPAGAPTSKRGRRAPGWDQGLPVPDLSPQELAWDERLGPRPKSFPQAEANAGESGSTEPIDPTGGVRHECGSG